MHAFLMSPSAAALARIAATGATAVAALALVAACSSSPPALDGAQALARSSQAMGAATLKSVRYAGEGTGYTFGQAYTPGGAWPRITLHSVTRTIDYDSGAMREEVVLSRAEPTGGGGYPITGQQRNDQYLSGDLAWNVAGGNAVAGPRFVAERTHQLWITPHGVLKAAQRNGATAAAGSDGGTVLRFADAGRFRAVVLLGADGLVRQVDSVYPDPVLGDTAVVTTYADYRDVDGVKFPMRVRQTMGGYPVLDLAIKEVQVNAAAALVVPDAARSTAERVTSEKVAEGVWFLAGGSHNSVAIELADQIVLVEAPLTDARTLAVMALTRTLAPGKPIRQVVNSHQHFDHSGGVRAAVAEGATIVTAAANVPYFERAFAQANALRPDRLSGSGRKAAFRGVDARLDIGDATRPVELHRIADSGHSDSFLMVWLPRERLLIEADAFTPGAPNAPAPAVANPNNVNLVANIERLGLPVERILPLHGRVVPVAELQAAVTGAR